MKENIKYGIMFVMLFLFACTAPEGKNCGTDKECLKSSFEKCEKAYGIWEGQNGDIGVVIKGKEGGFCTVSVAVKESGLDITNKTMLCGISMDENITFSIESGCSGELKDYFNE